MSDQIVIENRDLWMTCRFVVSYGYVDFQAFSWIGQTADGQNCAGYLRKGGTSSNDETDSIDDAEAAIVGNVKFDGCSNIDARPTDCMWHGCSLRDVEQLGRQLRWIYVTAAKMLGDKWCGGERE